jgi:hypothetical protein
MKVLCNKITDEALHIFTDSVNVYLSDNSLWFKYKEKPDFEIKGFSDGDFIIYENINIPKDWKSRKFKYNPNYGWKVTDIFNYKDEYYELIIRSFLKMCIILRDKNILSEDEYKNFLDFSEIESFLYHPISHYMPK